MRQFPTADVVLYVNPAEGSSSVNVLPAGTPYGIDAPGRGTIDAPFATPQYAADILYAQYDFQGAYKATIQLLSNPTGTYLYPGLRISGRLTGQGGSVPPMFVSPTAAPFVVGKYLPFTLRGDPARPDGAAITPGYDAYPQAAGLSISDGAAIKVDGITFEGTPSPFDNITMMGSGSFLEVGNIMFGNAGTPGDQGHNHISAGVGSWLFVTHSYKIAGWAWAHINLGANVTLLFNNNGDPGTRFTIPILGTPHLPAGLLLIDNSIAYLSSVDYVGPFVGPGATVIRNGVLQVTQNGTGVHSCEPVFTGSISGDTLTVTGTSSGTISIGQWLTAPGIAANTKIISGDGASSPWKVNVTQTLASTTISGSHFQGTLPIVRQDNAVCR